MGVLPISHNIIVRAWGNMQRAETKREQPPPNQPVGKALKAVRETSFLSAFHSLPENYALVSTARDEVCV